MPKEVVDFIQSQFLSVLAIEMLDGSPHAATLHFAFDEEQSLFLFETYRPYRKCEPLFGREISRASLVVGFDESNRKTLQLDGEVHLISSDTEEILFNKIYFGKFPKKKEKSLDPKFVKFLFIPKWWRYTDWENAAGKKILSSTDK